MTVAEILEQLRQAKSHLERARAAMRTAIEETGKARTLIRHTFDTSRDQAAVRASEQIIEHLNAAGQDASRTDQTINQWLARIAGTPPSGKA